MVFVIKNPGVLTTIQDSGRHGYQSIGISPAGALDYKSAFLANQLVNNEPGSAVLEMTLSGIAFIVTKNTTIATAGAFMPIRVNDVEYPVGRAILLAKGDQVEIGYAKKGLRTYLAVAGGFLMEPVLGSYSTHLRTNMGGYKGRALKKGDILSYNGANNENYFRVVKDELSYLDNAIRLVPGPNYADLTKQSSHALLNEFYTITRSNDRMGIRLEGEAMTMKDNVHDILSEPTQLGNIQVPKNGKPIILLNDRQTSGGYKRVASVAKADLPKLVQLQPDEKIRFEMITLEEATALYQKEMAKILSGHYLTTDKDFVYYRRVEAERIQNYL